jgi:hypothetical protein
MKYSVLIALVGLSQAADFDLVDLDAEELLGDKKKACAMKAKKWCADSKDPKKCFVTKMKWCMSQKEDEGKTPAPCKMIAEKKCADAKDKDACEKKVVAGCRKMMKNPCVIKVAKTCK